MGVATGGKTAKTPLFTQARAMRGLGLVMAFVLAVGVHVSGVASAANPGGPSETALQILQAAAAAPEAADDAYSLQPGTTLSVAAPGVLANDTDPDGDSLTVVPVAGASHGSLTVAPDGMFMYTPVAGFVGSDSFQYKASDGTSQSNVATVTLTVTGGTTTTTAPPVTTTAPPVTTTAPPSVDAAAIYSANCAGCHGADGSSAAFVSLVTSTMTYDEILNVIAVGSGIMPGYAGSLSPAELDALSTFTLAFQEPGATTTTTAPPVTTTAPPVNTTTTEPPDCTTVGDYDDDDCGGPGATTTTTTTAPATTAPPASTNPPTTTAPPATTTTAAPGSTTPPAAQSGEQLYGSFCAGCHGADAEGTPLGPDILDEDFWDIVDYIISGDEPEMPAFGNALTSQQVDAIAEYVVALSNGHNGEGGAPTYLGVLHPDKEDGFWHAEDKDRPYSSNCTSCHGADLRGMTGFTPSCYSCHGREWDERPPTTTAPPATTMPPATTTPPSGTTLPPATTTPPARPDGSALYAANCAGCHGANLEGGFGGALANTSLTAAQLDSITANGVGTMPAYAATLSAAEISAITQFILAP